MRGCIKLKQTNKMFFDTDRSGFTKSGPVLGTTSFFSDSSYAHRSTPVYTNTGDTPRDQSQVQGLECDRAL